MRKIVKKVSPADSECSQNFARNYIMQKNSPHMKIANARRALIFSGLIHKFFENTPFFYDFFEKFLVLVGNSSENFGKNI